MLVDADSQGTTSIWSDARKEKEVPQLPCVSLRGGKVHVELKELARHYEDVVIDTGGADSQEFRSALLAAHTLFMPLRPGSFDFWTLMKMQEVVSMADAFNEGLKAIICLSQVPPSARERAKREAAEVLAEMPRFTLMDAMVVFRAAFNHCRAKGYAFLRWRTGMSKPAPSSPSYMMNSSGTPDVYQNAEEAGQ